MSSEGYLTTGDYSAIQREAFRLGLYAAYYRSTYKSWYGARRRCTFPRDMNYHRYGGRGITMCERWLLSFQNFWDDMGRKPDGYTLERIDNNGPYSPENCCWADLSTQARNKRPRGTPSYGYVCLEAW